jgi:hypothetical protein
MLINVQPDTDFQRRNSRRFFACAFVGIALSQFWPWPNLLVRAAAAVAGLIAGYYAAAGLQALAIARRRCPRCGTPIGAQQNDPTPTVSLRCTDCNIDWDLGIRDRRRNLDDDPPLPRL